MKTQIIVRTFLIVFLFGYSLLPVEAQIPAQTLEEKREKTEGELPEQNKETPSIATNEKEKKKKWSFTYGGELTNYFISESNPFFGKSNKSWIETSLRVDGTISFKNFTAGASGIGIKTIGHDPFGTGTIPSGVQSETNPPDKFPSFYLDKAYIQLDRIGGLPLKATLGRQHIIIGSQFLIGDGVYDGFSVKTRQGVYHSPRKGFDALRIEWNIKKTRFDSFIYKVDPTWDGGGGGDGLFGGVDVSHTFEKTKGTYAAGIFYRSSGSKLDNNMAVFDLRIEQPLKLIDGLYASGELAWEFAGKCHNAAYCTTIGQKMNENSWHAELGYQAKQRKWRPFAEAGYVRYSKDFTPVSTGFSDWGKWYLGNQIDWIIFGTNTKIIRAQAGFYPTSAIKLRALFHNTRQIENTGLSTGGSLSNEITFIGEWYPKEDFWLNLAINQSVPGRALADSGLGNPFAFLNSGAVPVRMRNSFDVILATGWKF